MENQSVVVLGLPASGKTTFLAALWSLVVENVVDSRLKFGGLQRGDHTYLNEIAKRWQSAKVQERTSTAGSKVVSMSLLGANGKALTVTFPDLPGEAYRDMWETRTCTREISDALTAPAVLLFIHGDKIALPQWISEMTEVAALAGTEAVGGAPVQWSPRLAPTQVQVVALLQMLRSMPLDIGRRRLAIMISAWDKVEAEELTPHEFLAQKLPLLNQHLTCNEDGWEWSVYGVSAQGGDYNPVDADKPRAVGVDKLLELANPSERIKVVGDGTVSHDLTEPLEWLMQ